MKNKKTKAQKKELTPVLPQNIMPMGERVLENKNIYIHQRVYSQIHSFAANKTENEHGGILVGRVLNELGKENTIIEGFIEAKYNTATPTTLTFTHETWDYFHKEMESKFKNKKIVGWIHTHPNFGIFLSENDRFIQENFFDEKNQVAYVVDPIQNEEGFFFWVDEKLEKCPGFFLFDKNGVKIKQREVKEKNEEQAPAKMSFASIIVSVVLAFALVVSMIFSFVQADTIKKLEKRVKDLEIVCIADLYNQNDPNMISKRADVVRPYFEQNKKVIVVVGDSDKNPQENETSENNPDGENKPENN